MLKKLIIVSYNFSKFKKTFNLIEKPTIRGTMRRFAKKHPTITYLTRSTIIFSSIFIIAYLFVPGDSFPYQHNFKVSYYEKLTNICYFWYIDRMHPNYEQYIIKCFQILLIGIQQQIYDKNWITNILTIATKKGKKELSLKDSSKISSFTKISIIVYVSLVLNNIIRYKKIFLKDQTILKTVEDIFQECFIEFQYKNLTKNDQEKIFLAFNLLQYLLKFEHQTSSLQKLLNGYLEIIQKKDMRFFAIQTFNQKEVIQCFKSIYSKQPLLQDLIMKIFNKLDTIHNTIETQVK